jgi:hypothetical protein
MYTALAISGPEPAFEMVRTGELAAVSAAPLKIVCHWSPPVALL